MYVFYACSLNSGRKFRFFRSVLRECPAPRFRCQRLQGSRRLPDGGKPVGDGDGCPVFRQIFQAFLDPAFTFIVQGAGGLVKDQDRRILQEHPGNGDPLFLSAGKTGSPLAHKGVIAVRQGLR